MFCPNCGTKNEDHATFCNNCGNRLTQVEAFATASNTAQTTIPAGQPTSINVNVSAPAYAAPQLPAQYNSDTAGLLAIFFGILGIHDFYVGKTGNGVIKLILTLTGVFSIVSAIWTLVDVIKIVCGSYTDNWNRPLQGSPTITKILIILYILLILAIFAGCCYLFYMLSTMF